MRRYIIIFTLFTAFTANAYADFNAGMDAYTKNDYRTAMEEFQLLADQGNADAQFMLGYMYASGKGVPQDYIQAHLWFNLAAAQGSGRAVDSRDKIAKVMTPQQISESQKMAREWQPKEVSERQDTRDTRLYDTSGPTGTELIRAIQENLSALGYEPGPADGRMGSRTRWAIRDYQKQAGLSIDGEPSQALLEHIQKEIEKRFAQRKVPQKVAASSTSETPLGVKAAPAEQTQEIVDELKKIVQKGENESRVDSRFLAELKELIKRYDWPWGTRIFRDAFKDGDLTRNPKWSIVSGDFWVDSNSGLMTRFESPEQKREPSSNRQTEDTGTRIFNSILGEIFKEKEKESSSSVQPMKAEIYSGVNISNSFSMDIELRMLAGGNDARLEIGPYKGRQRDEGYRLIYVGGQTPTFELARQSYRGSSIIDISKSATLMSDGRVHVIRWQRYSDGNMIVAVDGEVIIRTIDRTLQDSFDGISIVNHNGEYAVGLIDVHGKKD